jgi:hypothetical protein
MPELNFQLEIPVTPRSFRGVLALVLAAACAGDLASESVTLTTYYPAPSGAYTQLVAAQNVILARDTQVPSGTDSFLSVGTSAAPTNPGVKLVVTGGNVGVTTSLPFTPSVQLEIASTNGGAGANFWQASVDLNVNGRLELANPSGDANNAGGLCLNSSNPCTMMVGQVPSNQIKPANNVTLGIYNDPAGVASSWRLTMSNAGNVGIGVDPVSPAYPLVANSNLDVNGSIAVGLSPASCTLTTYVGSGPNPSSSCAPNKYATYFPGLLTHYQTGEQASLSYSGQMYCCPCSNGTCPNLIP